MAKNEASAGQPTGALDQSELKRYPGYFLARARYIAFKTFDQHIGRAYELRPVDFSVLLLLGSNGEVTQSQLSVALGVAPSNMTGLLRRLQERGLIQRTRAETDKRMQFIALTPAGETLIEGAHSIGRAMDKGWLGRLTRAEQAMLLELLDKVSMAPRV
ncbi:MAG TPA: MarR family transcriptional regulator [Ramlibacter sp.]|nr:MarR family transcriptional regulator [Ramlibacter sp.]